MQLSRTPQAELTLNPADLGRLSIHLSLGEQTTSAHFVAAHQQVRAAVEASLADLRQALDAQGHALSEVTISGEDEPELKSRMLLLLSGQNPQELTSQSGKLALQTTLRDELSRPYSEGGQPLAITGVLYNDFIVQ
ncbi:flagellar hook-length control protein FliK [Cobetia sp. ICG0124]|uniref:flagellar hook-length control protein FliK n=1 Tax=Cobetia sp. ICG0124 TaxID=2053669 RepID=UPI000FDBB75B|nr:flagellar hook-length control protein FliK [Cobetia sp. ICG0124]